MPKYTEHYSLKKPLQEEFYDIDDHNGNMDIIDRILKELSEDSGVIISPDEPEKGEVWIDTDDEDGEGGAPVTSVNGKTGDVVLTAQDLDVYTVGQTYSKEEVNNLLPKAYTHPETHPASMITETDAIKMFLATERIKLAGIEEQANKYVHPDTHPATMISGLDEYLTSLGYEKAASGSYLGDGTGECTVNSNHTQTFSPRTITLPFIPNVVMLMSKTTGNTIIIARDSYITQTVLTNGSTNVNAKIIYLTDSSLQVVSSIGYPYSKTAQTEWNTSGNTYYWIAF